MRRMGFCEEQGSGLDIVIKHIEVYQLPAPIFRSNNESMQIILHGYKKFADMTSDERIWACYYHAVLKNLSGGQIMKNQSLCNRLGIKKENAAQASLVIKSTLNKKLIKYADPDKPRLGYIPY